RYGGAAGIRRSVVRVQRRRRASRRSGRRRARPIGLTRRTRRSCAGVVSGAGHNGAMTQPVTLGGRPMMPPPGASAEERLIARFRSQAPGLFWSAVLLIGVSGATAYFYDNLPEGFENWMLLAAAAALVI